MSVLFAARPRTGGTRSAGRHRPFTCQHWRSKDCNLKRAAPSDVWGNLCIIVTTRKVLAEKSRWLMGFPLDRCGIAPAIAAILAPTSLALFPWNVPIVLNIQFSRSRKYFLLYTPNMKFSLLVVTHFLRVACKPAAVQRGLGRAPKICVWISKRYASKTVCQQVGGLWAPFPSQSVRKPAGRVNHAMIHSLPTFPVHSEKVNHSMIHFWGKTGFACSKNRR